MSNKIKNNKWRWYRPWIEKWIPKPSLVNKFMIDVFEDFEKMKKPSSFFMSTSDLMLNPKWRRWKPWIEKRIKKPIDPNAKTVEFDIVRGNCDK